MPAKTGSRNGLSYGWALGENNWNTGMDGNLTFIDRFGVHLSFKSFLNTPPGSPAAGDCHVIDTVPTGVWVGKAGQVAVYDDGAWRYGAPRTGWQAYCEADERLYVYDGGWAPTASEWSAATVDQAEAEAGTATTDRKWTSQRVRQAIAAWWLTASSAFGRTLATAADAAAARAALVLGTAALAATGQADPNVPTNSDVRAYYGVRYKPAVAPTLVIDFENSYFAIYNASTNSLFVADTWDAFATYLGADLTISRAGEQTYFDALGVMRTAAANTVQCDHDPLTGRRLGPYFGGARTNLLLNSEAPATQSVNVTAQAYTLSFYGTGSIALSGAHTATLVGSGAFPVRSTLTFTPTDGTLTLTVSGVQKFQLEAGLSASPYIPTTTAAVTRPATAVTIGGIKFTGAVSGSEATLVAKAITADVITAADRRICMLSDGTVNNRFSLHINGSSIRVYANASGAFLYGPSVGTAFVGVPFSVALSGKSGRYASACKGVAAAEGLVSGFGAFNRVQIGYGVTSQQFDGWVQAVTVYPRALNTSQDTELSK